MTPPPTTRPRRHAEPTNAPGPRARGVVFIAVAILLVVFIGFAALVVDMGMVHATRAQMTSASESAAVEGLRFKDVLLDSERRLRASQRVLLLNDEDQDLATNDTTYGIGPVITIGPGEGAPLSLRAKLDVGMADPDDSLVGHPKWKRSEDVGGGNIGWLELNLANAEHGDLVAGDYDDSFTSGSPIHNDGPAGDYDRPDLAHAVNPGDDQSAFLVRLRRTTRDNGVPWFDANDRIDGESSSGPALPLILARASMIRQPTGGGFNPRVDELTIRATAIADSRPALTVGPIGYLEEPAVGGPVEGVAPFALSLDYWNSGLLPIGVPDDISVDTAGATSGLIRRVADVGTPSPPRGLAFRSTTLASTLAAASNSMTVRSDAGFPATGEFVVRIGSELILVPDGNVPGVVWNGLTRGFDGTAPQTHTVVNAPLGQQQLVVVSDIAHAGQPMDPNESDAEFAAPYAVASGRFLVPLFEDITVAGLGTERTIVGFGRIQLAVAGVFPPNRFTITKLAARVAPRNASSTFPRLWLLAADEEFIPGGVDDAIEMSDTEQDEFVNGVLAAHALISDDETVLAPSLVRTYSP